MVVSSGVAAEASPVVPTAYSWIVALVTGCCPPRKLPRTAAGEAGASSVALLSPQPVNTDTAANRPRMLAYEATRITSSSQRSRIVVCTLTGCIDVVAVSVNPRSVSRPCRAQCWLQVIYRSRRPSPVYELAAIVINAPSRLSAFRSRNLVRVPGRKVDVSNKCRDHQIRYPEGSLRP